MCKSIMVVDDSELWNIMMYDILTRLGYSCITVQNAEDAVELYIINKPDLILMDIVMPDKDGIECAREILCKDKNVKIIILSALIMAKDVVPILTIGVLDIVHKFSFKHSCEDNILFHKIKEVLLHNQNQKYDISLIKNELSSINAELNLSPEEIENVLASSIIN